MKTWRKQSFRHCDLLLVMLQQAGNNGKYIYIILLFLVFPVPVAILCVSTGEKMVYLRSLLLARVYMLWCSSQRLALFKTVLSSFCSLLDAPISMQEKVDTFKHEEKEQVKHVCKDLVSCMLSTRSM